MKRLILLLTVFIYFSCNDKHRDLLDGREIVLDINFNSKVEDARRLKTSELFDSVSFIRIKSDSPIMVGHIRDIRFVNKKYYLLDDLNSSLYILDELGKVLNILDCRGRARNEYLRIYQFDVNPTNGDIHIYDGRSQKINVYSDDVSFIRSVKVDQIIRDFAVMNDESYVFYTPDFVPSNRRGLWRSNKNGRDIIQLVDIDEEFQFGGIFPKYFKRVNNHTIALMGGEDQDHIYHITVDSLSVRYRVDVDINISKSIQEVKIIDFEEYAGLVYSKRNYFETDGLMFFTITDFDVNKSIFYIKKNNQLFSCESSDDLIEDIPFYTSIKGCGDNRFIGILTSEQIVNNKFLKEEFSDIELEDFPILCVAYVKK